MDSNYFGLVVLLMRYICLFFSNGAVMGQSYQWRNRPYSQTGSSDLEMALEERWSLNNGYRSRQDPPRPAALRFMTDLRKNLTLSRRKTRVSLAEMSMDNDVNVQEKSRHGLPRFVSENDMTQEDPSESTNYGTKSDSGHGQPTDSCIVLDLAATLPWKNIPRRYGPEKMGPFHAISKAFPHWWRHVQSGQSGSDHMKRANDYDEDRCLNHRFRDNPINSCNSKNDIRYRSYDGTCNNLHYPQFGSVNSRYSRLTRAKYDDGISRPRQFSVLTGYGGLQFVLPNPRVISRSMSQSIPIPHRVANILLPSFGQMIAHDLVFTESHKIDRRDADCCYRNAHCTEPECFQFSIPRNDPLYAFFNLTCHQFARSVPSLETECASPELGSVVREQASKVTHWLDASFLYGNSEDKSGALRNLFSGQLAFRHGEKGIHNLQNTEVHKQMLPTKSEPVNFVSGCPHATRKSRGRSCFHAGDERVNQQPLAAAIHTVFLRLHNLVAAAVAQVYRHYTDEAIFQEARKIVIAVYQIIIYKEFLPGLWGSEVSTSSLHEDTGLKLLETAHYLGYDAGLDPHVLNEFAAAGFRLHTLVDDSVPRLLLLTGLAENRPLSTQFNNQTVLYEEGNADALISGMLEELALAFDPQISEELQGRLFRGQGQDPLNPDLIGLDLMAISIQRGRDHGLGTYNDARAACGYGRAEGFGGLRDFMPAHHVQLLRLLYRDVEDIDLMVGGLMEDPLAEDASVGPTFACIISTEFRLKRSADRFWHENPDQFSNGQLRYLRRITMSYLLCQTTGLRYVPSNAFLVVSERNPLVPCLMMNDFDLDFYFSLPGLSTKS